MATLSDADAPVTPLGQLVFFSQFLATAGLFHDWVKACPLLFASNNAPALNDLLARSRWPFGNSRSEEFEVHRALPKIDCGAGAAKG